MPAAFRFDETRDGALWHPRSAASGRLRKTSELRDRSSAGCGAQAGEPAVCRGPLERSSLVGSSTGGAHSALGDAGFERAAMPPDFGFTDQEYERTLSRYVLAASFSASPRFMRGENEAPAILGEVSRRANHGADRIHVPPSEERLADIPVLRRVNRTLLSES